MAAVLRIGLTPLLLVLNGEAELATLAAPQILDHQLAGDPQLLRHAQRLLGSFDGPAVDARDDVSRTQVDGREAPVLGIEAREAEAHETPVLQVRLGPDALEE